MNLPAIQRIAMEFERENDMMDQRQEMMDDAIDDTFEDEEEESDEIVNQVLDEIGVDLSQSVFLTRLGGCVIPFLARGNTSKCTQQTTRHCRPCPRSYRRRRRPASPT